MMEDQDISEQLQARVRQATEAGTALRILGGNSKAFYGRRCDAEPLETSEHQGILSYEPTELVITARCGTPLDALEQALAAQGQMLPFEPPRFAPGGTIGGAVACGLAGPRRPWGGAPRDLLLGVKLLDGRGRILEFGGQVMKNVAGYDLSRLMAGALGTLGVLLEVSIKVLPRPPREVTLAREMDAARAVKLMQELQGRPLPLTGACQHDGRLLLRLAGSEQLTGQIAAQLAAEQREETGFWDELRDQRLPFFEADTPLWRLSLPPAARTDLDDEALIDWGGAQRWVHSDRPASLLQDTAARHGGHATAFRHGDHSAEVFHPLSPPLQRLHRSLKAVFDPQGILNPGRLYAGW